MGDGQQAGHRCEHRDWCGCDIVPRTWGARGTGHPCSALTDATRQGPIATPTSALTRTRENPSGTSSPALGVSKLLPFGHFGGRGALAL